MLETSTGRCGPVMRTNEVQDFCRKGAKVEVLAPSNRWREAQVVRVGGGVARIHYTGYDAQFDEEVGGQGLNFSFWRTVERIHQKSAAIWDQDTGRCSCW